MLNKNLSNLVSVIIPYHKKIHFIDKCIESVLSQTLQNFEIILIYDDNELDAELDNELDNEVNDELNLSFLTLSFDKSLYFSHSYLIL